MAEALEERERLAAKERQREHGSTAPGKAKDTSANLAPVLSGKSRTKVAKAVGTGHASLKKIREVCEAAEAEPWFAFELQGENMTNSEESAKAEAISAAAGILEKRTDELNPAWKRLGSLTDEDPST